MHPQNHDHDVAETPARRHGRLVRSEVAAPYVGWSQSTLSKKRLAGGDDSPPYYKVGRLCMYDLDELDAWLQARRRRSTSEAPSQEDGPAETDAHAGEPNARAPARADRRGAGSSPRAGAVP